MSACYKWQQVAADYFTFDKVENLKVGVSRFINTIKLYSVVLGLDICSLVFIVPLLLLNFLI